MDSKDASAMEEGQAGLSLNQGEFSPVNHSPNSKPTEQSSKFPLNSSEISQPLRYPLVSNLFSQGINERTQSGPKPSPFWQSIVNIFWQRKAHQTEDAPPRGNRPATREPIVRGRRLIIRVTKENWKLTHQPFSSRTMCYRLSSPCSFSGQR